MSATQPSFAPPAPRPVLSLLIIMPVRISPTIPHTPNCSAATCLTTCLMPMPLTPVSVTAYWVAKDTTIGSWIWNLPSEVGLTAGLTLVDENLPLSPPSFIYPFVEKFGRHSEDPPDPDLAFSTRFSGFPSSSVPESIPSSSVVPYASRFKASLRNLRKLAPPTYLDDGTPVVHAPESVLLKAYEMWKEHIITQFHGLLPPASVVYANLNPFGGKCGNMTMRKLLDYACLILIPSVATRDWVLEVGYWQAGNCGFNVSPWSASASLVLPDLVSAPTWAVLKNVPPMLYSLDGISVIASAIGDPLHTENSRLDVVIMGATKVKVEIMLDSSPPETVIVRDLCEI
ncbi:unnamed protein product [Microthlaspi erraticum]|uniref:Uncharacterized protein n=1 Tax=Microthlaspi erraticum TaxID=1685480 RepID=A0A6D2IIY4_9BRAS|nr:unnamed protein product [Microthlaspi erraticum]